MPVTMSNLDDRYVKGDPVPDMTVIETIFGIKIIPMSSIYSVSTIAHAGSFKWYDESNVAKRTPFILLNITKAETLALLALDSGEDLMCKFMDPIATEISKYGRMQSITIRTIDEYRIEHIKTFPHRGKI